jgi:predicted Zn-ribbon and HTH transcriptional regulator
MPVRPNIRIKITCLNCGYKTSMRPKSDAIRNPSKCKKCGSPNIKTDFKSGRFLFF